MSRKLTETTVLETGEKILPGSVRPDGTVRKERRIRAGYTPQDEQPVYQSRGMLAKQNVPTCPGMDELEVAVLKQQAAKGKKPSSAASLAPKPKPTANTSTGSKDATVVSSVSKGATRPAQAASASAPEAAAAAVSAPSEPEDPRAALEKQIRNLKKKIRQCSDLAEKQQSGSQLDKDQEEKLAKSVVCTSLAVVHCSYTDVDRVLCMHGTPHVLPLARPENPWANAPPPRNNFSEGVRPYPPALCLLALSTNGTQAGRGGSPLPNPSGSPLDTLPDEILIQIFGHLAVVGGIWEDDDPLRLSTLPYRQSDMEIMPCTGLRGYPFLAQQFFGQRVCIDLGQELVTFIHTPLRWSNQRPTAAEYQAAFQKTTLSASKVLHFLTGVSPHVRSLVVANTEGFDGDDGEYVSLADKHNFGPAHLGFALALLRNTLAELVIYRCNDLLLSGDSGLWSLSSQLPRLRILAVEGLRGLLTEGQVAELGGLKQLEALVLTGEEYRSDFAVGLEGIPAAWSKLTALTRQQKRRARRAHARQRGSKVNLALGHIPPDPNPSDAEIAAAALSGQLPARRALPDLQPLAPCLTSLSLSNNRFTQLPEWLHRLTRLEHLDVAYNKYLQLRTPLSGLAALPHIRLLDFRSVHVGKDKSYWCEAKCTTMHHLSKLAKALKRRSPQPRLLIDI
ncbi:hypothetical protein VOLCADRAFT_102916 [Volvox carteri f. nagariensis]|uniref:WIBG Mago-binding domain-containing protein n=1 Tax=Volvox carteri f. nagariensis TaxID=3068 RepID=D8TGT3_VOLCA|nr:uncharacterized protein VOLCADRAFT_102916 [Volvox carteri f. nagariensis]EFJ53315.1 hypothetical protein VOLCADRAFT_102916 [Volvox carteri f. nagariensis]|eukprot:XP_002946320.1 hypothetical protein VOLCADRAFT_102916 [Volvox carteri f. nagariensis]